MGTSTTFQGRLDEAIMSAVRTRIKIIVEEESAKAITQIHKKIAESVDSITLNILKNYSIQDIGTHLTIHVKKDIDNDPTA